MDTNDTFIIVRKPGSGGVGTEGGSTTAITLADLLATTAFEDAVNALIAAAA